MSCLNPYLTWHSQPISSDTKQTQNSTICEQWKRSSLQLQQAGLEWRLHEDVAWSSSASFSQQFVTALALHYANVLFQMKENRYPMESQPPESCKLCFCFLGMALSQNCCEKTPQTSFVKERERVFASSLHLSEDNG